MNLMEREIGEFAKVHNEIDGVFLFGSAATGNTHEGSDVDIAILIGNGEGNTESMRLAMAYSIELEDLLHEKVDVVILNAASPLLRHQVFKKGRLVFARDSRRVRRFIGDAVVEYLDEIVLIERLQKRSIRRLTGGR